LAIVERVKLTKPWSLSLVAHINIYFDTNLLSDRLEYKIKLVKKMERVKGLSFFKSKMIFSMISSIATVSHKYIEWTSTILLVVKNIKGVTVTCYYYSGVYSKVEPMIKPAIISLSNNECFELYKAAGHDQQIRTQ
jgi:hypothetical protein